MPAKGPDPAEFEPEFVVDDEAPSRSETPRPTNGRTDDVLGEQKMNGSAGRELSQDDGEIASTAEAPRTSSDLPTDIRVKLRKLEKLESRYHGG